MSLFSLTGKHAIYGYGDLGENVLFTVYFFLLLTFLIQFFLVVFLLNVSVSFEIAEKYVNIYLIVLFFVLFNT